MLRTERDYILRMIAAAAAVAARLRERLTGGASAPEIAQQARAAQTALLGPETGLLRALDARSAAHAVGDRERIEAWVALIRVEADALDTAGDSGTAARLRARALTLEQLARPQKQER